MKIFNSLCIDLSCQIFCVCMSLRMLCGTGHLSFCSYVYGHYGDGSVYGHYKFVHNFIK